MRLSHSKLNTILTCPMTYKVIYRLGFRLKEGKPALRLGSAVHEGIEKETDDLTDFYQKEGSFMQANQYTQEQELAEAMVAGYLRHKDSILADILIDDETGDTLELLSEEREVDLLVPLPSLIPGREDHLFRGIIDLLLLTNKGFIIIDYKTSSRRPEWDNYLEQLYRYVYIVETMFPEVPIYKLAIINLRKTGIRQRKLETEEQFRQRLRMEYELNDEDYINFHVYSKDVLDKEQMDYYILNLRKSADFANYIDTTSNFYLNYGNLITVYGRSEFYDIFKRTPDAHILYNISDTILGYDELTDELKIQTKRDARQIDIDAVFEQNILHKYEQFKTVVLGYYAVNEDTEKENIMEYIKQTFKTDDELLELYWKTLEYEVEKSIEIKSDEDLSEEYDDE